MNIQEILREAQALPIHDQICLVILLLQGIEKEMSKYPDQPNSG